MIASTINRQRNQPERRSERHSGEKPNAGLSLQDAEIILPWGLVRSLAIRDLRQSRGRPKARLH